jgi:hypothetical protein
MSMFVRSLSPWQQMQNWRIGQGNINSQQLGSLGAPADYSASFASAASRSPGFRRRPRRPRAGR